MKQTHLWQLCLAICLMAFSACTPASTERSKLEDKTGIPDTLYFGDQPIPLSQGDSTCLAQPAAICEYGLQIAFLGMPLSALHVDDEGVQITDRKFSEGGYEWMGKEISFPDGGTIMLEGEFVDEGDPAQRLPNSTINRIRIESEQFHTLNGISVGSAIAELRSQYPDSAFRAYYIPDYQMIDISLPELSRIHFNIPGNDTLAQQANGELLVVPIEQLNQDQAIKAIVVVM